MKVYSFRSLKSLRCANVNDKWSVIETHLGWPSRIDLEPGSVLLLKVSRSILSGANLRGLV